MKVYLSDTMVWSRCPSDRPEKAKPCAKAKQPSADCRLSAIGAVFVTDNSFEFRRVPGLACENWRA